MKKNLTVEDYIYCRLTFTSRDQQVYVLSYKSNFIYRDSVDGMEAKIIIV